MEDQPQQIIPNEIIRHILSYTGTYRFHKNSKQNGVWSIVRLIEKTDKRYVVLQKIPEIVGNVFGAEVVLFRSNKKKVTLMMVDLPSRMLCYKYAVHTNDNYEMWDVMPVGGCTFRY
jgi:hypothetical protein